MRGSKYGYYVSKSVVHCVLSSSSLLRCDVYFYQVSVRADREVMFYERFVVMCSVAKVNNLISELRSNISKNVRQKSFR